MKPIGDCDNSPMELFWGRIQTELLDRKYWTTIIELSVAKADYIVTFNNIGRRHSSLDYLAPFEFEALELVNNPFKLT